MSSFLAQIGANLPYIILLGAIVAILAWYIITNAKNISHFTGTANGGSGGAPMTGPSSIVGRRSTTPNLSDPGVPYSTGANGGASNSSNGPAMPPMATTPPVEHFANPSEPSTMPFAAGNAPSNCYPKNQLSAKDLLPEDPNSKWAQVNPQGAGDITGKNYLNAGALIGVNTVGQSLRNASWDLRSEPANPQVAVSPWFNSTIEPDINRRMLEIQ